MARTPATAKNNGHDVSALVAAEAERCRTLTALLRASIRQRLPELPENQWRGTLVAKLTADERELAKALGWTTEDIAKHIARERAIATQQARAGTAAERDAAAQRLAEAHERLATRGSEIAAQIEALQREYNTLENETRAAQHDVDTRAAAVQRLRELAEQDDELQHSLSVAQREELQPIEAKIAERRNRATALHEIVDIDVARELLAEPDRGDRLAAVMGEEPFSVQNTQYSRLPAHLDAPRWERLRQRAIEELPDIEAEIRELQKQRDEMRSAIQYRILSIYVPA